MHWSSPWFITLLSSGILLILAGALLTWLPPRRINPIYGYRTRRAQKDQESWDLAQKHSSKELFWKGTALMAISCLGRWIVLSDTWATVLSAIVIILVLILMVFNTEKALKERQSKNQ